MGILPVSCIDQCDGPCGCNPVFEVEDFSITTFSAETLFRADRNFEVDPNRFYFHQTLYKAFWVSGLKPVSEIQPAKGFIFSNAALACSPRESYSVERLKSIRLINKRKVKINETLTLEEGGVINENFRMTQNFQQEFELAKFIDNQHRFIKNERLYLKFIAVPNQNIELFFDLEIELDNGSVYIFNESMKVNGG
ncbi:hypothetical protein M3O96_07095 [Aquiflexum sp. TKW24L]|uniref:hypothetical protein n=1 Tax=Aquiflexum sp. TKW24L TaxID=2942212 RepID=UPI0020BDD165|nr:hypothetical protein [Aquiflexum sp. TKW24L]MCL6258844.1 hypothetical protein [Aquiflexum sp. TKW24L]